MTQRKTKNLSILAILSLTGLSSLANNSQVWTQENVFYDVGSGFTAGLSQENRIGVNEWEDRKKHLDEIHVAPSLDCKVIDWLSVGANYRHVLLRDGTDSRYRNDRRPSLDVVLKEKIGGVSLLNRSRFICRVPEGENPYFRYRNLSRVSYDLGQYVPFVSYEWYYDEGSRHRPYRKNDRFSQQWLTFGFDWKLSRGFKATLYYMLTENKDRTDHSWHPGHVIGVGISYLF